MFSADGLLCTSYGISASSQRISKPLPSGRRKSMRLDDRFKEKRRRLRLCCAQVSGEDNEEEEETTETNPLEGIEGIFERMLLDSPAVKSAIERISAASEKYEETLRKKIELEQQQTGLTPEQKDEIAKITERRILAEAEVEAAHKRMKAAELRKIEAMDETNFWLEMAKRNEERIESVKTFTVTSIGGVSALIPILLAEVGDLERGFLNLLGTALSSGLFGITYRYAIGDGRNAQLKFGVVAAFWIATSLGFAQATWNAVKEPLSHFDIHIFNKAGLHSVQALIVFLASSLALELSFRSGFVRHTTTSVQV